MRLRAARRYERFQSAASALGQRLDANGEKNPSKSFQGRCAVARQGRSFFSSDGKYQLSVNDCALHYASTGDDRALPTRLVSDATDRPAAVSRLHLLDFELLSGGTEGAAAENVVAHISVHAVCDGHGHWHFRAQRASCH